MEHDVNGYKSSEVEKALLSITKVGKFYRND